MIQGLIFGKTRTTRVEPMADVAYGPCAGGVSAFCEGRGTARLDTLALFDTAMVVRDIIICGPCSAVRSGFLVEDLEECTESGSMWAEQEEE